jgi:hypothetical protein
MFRIERRVLPATFPFEQVDRFLVWQIAWLSELLLENCSHFIELSLVVVVDLLLYIVEILQSTHRIILWRTLRKDKLWSSVFVRLALVDETFPHAN